MIEGFLEQLEEKRDIRAALSGLKAAIKTQENFHPAKMAQYPFPVVKVPVIYENSPVFL